MELIAILVVLFAALAILLPWLEKRARQPSPEKLQRISRWLVPLIALAIVLQVVWYWVG
jgi:cadmium resistance protein CadD (predicted permease)